jgi:hypothetical protein
VAERAWKENALDIKNGDMFRQTSDGMDFVVKKIVKNMAVLESQDGKR